MASKGDIVIYTPTADELTEFNPSTELPAMVVEDHSATDCSLAIFYCSGNSGQLRIKRCNEDNSSPYDEGTWRPLA